MKKDVVTISIILIVACCMLGIKAYGINNRERTANEAPVKKYLSLTKKTITANNAAEVHANDKTDKQDSKYAGMKECVDCHSSAANSFVKSVHGKHVDPRTPAAKHECESCHGPGNEHTKAEEDANVEGVLLGPIVTFGAKAKTPIKKQNETCLECHATSKTHILWQGSTHEVRGLACASCHKVHGSHPKLLAKPDEMTLCTQCHLRVKGDIQKPSHHPIREGELTCSNCHNTHGSVGNKLISANTVNEKCYQCHADKRGPFLWPHAPAVENCLNCHTPHGSQHDFLLESRPPWLCQRCHNGEGHQGIMQTLNMFPPATASSVYKLRPQLYNRSCWQCHVAVHGSNSPSGNTFLR